MFKTWTARFKFTERVSKIIYAFKTYNYMHKIWELNELGMTHNDNLNHKFTELLVL